MCLDRWFNNNKEFKNGDFIELQGEFSINPLIDLLNTFSNFFENIM